MNITQHLQREHSDECGRLDNQVTISEHLPLPWEDPSAPRGHAKYPGPVQKTNLVLVASLRQSDYYFKAPSSISTVEGNVAIAPNSAI